MSPASDRELDGSPCWAPRGLGAQHTTSRASNLPMMRNLVYKLNPPTQRNGLLDSPTTKAKRSTNQSHNLRASFEKLQASLDKTFPEQARAI